METHLISCLSTKLDRKAAKRFFKKALGSNHNQMPRIITVDKNPSYPIAIDELQNEKNLFKKKVNISGIHCKQIAIWCAPCNVYRVFAQ
jgi:transposase-like protein